jgi:DNA polymerase-3 subunit delta'
VPVVEGEDSGAIRIEPQRYPWHDAQWATLTGDVSRLAHALLLHGPTGLGKNAFALRLARFLLCLDRRDASACECCRSCNLFRAGNHPDLLCVRPLEDSKQIVVDQIRAVIEFLSFKAHTSRFKIVILAPAEAMNMNAANSLLKALEEPPAGSLFVLVASHPARVPVTIRSRCTQLAFGAPPRPQAAAWLRSQSGIADPEALLAQAGGAPLAAAALAEADIGAIQAKLKADLEALARAKADPVVCAESWKLHGVELCLDWLQHQVGARIRARVTAQPLGDGKSLSISIIDLFHFLDMVSMARRQLGSGADETLILEQLLIRWSGMVASTGRN